MDVTLLVFIFFIKNAELTYPYNPVSKNHVCLPFGKWDTFRAATVAVNMGLHGHIKNVFVSQKPCFTFAKVGGKSKKSVCLLTPKK